MKTTNGLSQDWLGLDFDQLQGYSESEIANFIRGVQKRSNGHATEEEILSVAKDIFEDVNKPDEPEQVDESSGPLDDIGEYFFFTSYGDCILDGRFTAEQLHRIANYMEQKGME